MLYNIVNAYSVDLEDRNIYVPSLKEFIYNIVNFMVYNYNRVRIIFIEGIRSIT